MRPLPVALALVTLAFPRAGWAQTPPTFSSEAEIVKVTATVFDGSGELVTDLQREDFELLEDDVPQQIQLFARAYDPGQDETLALDVGMLMDTSESMLDELQLSQMAAVRFLDAIPRARDLLTIFFDQDIRVSRYDSEHQQGLIRRILESAGGGNTALYDAITVYLSRVYGSGGRQVMVLFSDGEDSFSTVSMGETLEMVRSSSVVIYPIAFGSAPGTRRRDFRSMAFMRQLASISGGEVFRPMGAHSLPEIYDKILSQLKAQYVIGFVSTNTAIDGEFRKLELRVARDGLEVRHRQGYYGPAPYEEDDELIPVEETDTGS